MGAFAEERPGAVLGEALTVDLDVQHTVEHEVDLGAFLTLVDESCRPSPSIPGLAPPA